MPSSVRVLRSDGRRNRILTKMGLRFTLLLIFYFLLHTSSLHLGDSRISRLSALPEGIYKNSTSADLETLAEQIDMKSFRNNKGKNNDHSSEKTGSFLKCVFTFNGAGSSDKPEYVCKHSEDVKMEWHEENGRLTGIITTSIGCPKQESSNNKMQSRRYKLGHKLKQSIRQKRLTIYRNYTEGKKTQDRDVEQIKGEENIHQAESDGESKEEDTLKAPQVTQLADDEEKNTDRDKNEKGVNGDDTASFKLSDESEEVPAENEGETTDKEPAAQEENKDEEKDGEKGDDPKPDNDESKPGNDEPKLGNDEPKPDIDDPKPDIDDPKPDIDDPKPDNNDPKPDNDKPEPSSTAIVDDFAWITGLPFDEIDLDINVGIELIINPTTILDFIDQLVDIFGQAGDYILSLLLKNLKKGLQKSHMYEKFNAKVEKIATSRNVENETVLLAMKKAIDKAFGKSYDLELVKYLKILQDGLKL